MHLPKFMGRPVKVILGIVLVLLVVTEVNGEDGRGGWGREVDLGGRYAV
jgi:hypothetical protein